MRHVSARRRVALGAILAFGLSLGLARSATATSIFLEPFDGTGGLSFNPPTTTGVALGDGTVKVSGTGTGGLNFVGSIVDATLPGLTFHLDVVSLGTNTVIKLNLGFLDNTNTPIGSLFGFIMIMAPGSYSRPLSDITPPVGTVKVRGLLDIGNFANTSSGMFMTTLDRYEITALPEPSGVALLAAAALACASPFRRCWNRRGSRP